MLDVTAAERGMSKRSDSPSVGVKGSSPVGANYSPVPNRRVASGRSEVPRLSACAV